MTFFSLCGSPVFWSIRYAPRSSSEISRAPDPVVPSVASATGSVRVPTWALPEVDSSGLGRTLESHTLAHGAAVPGLVAGRTGGCRGVGCDRCELRGAFVSHADRTTRLASAYVNVFVQVNMGAPGERSLFCKQGVGGSSPPASSKTIMRRALPDDESADGGG